MVDTGKVINVANEGSQIIVDIEFMDNTKRTVVLPSGDINKYKNKYVICGIDSDENTAILEIVDNDFG